MEILNLFSVEEISGPVLLIMLFNSLYMEVLWMSCDLLANFCFIWVAKKLILMLEFNYIVLYRALLPLTYEKSWFFSILFHKVYCALLTSLFILTLLILIFPLVLRSFLHSFHKCLSPVKYVSIYFPWDTLTCLFHIESHFVTSCLYFWPLYDILFYD